MLTPSLDWGSRSSAHLLPHLKVFFSGHTLLFYLLYLLLSLSSQDTHYSLACFISFSLFSAYTLLFYLLYLLSLKKELNKSGLGQEKSPRSWLQIPRNWMSSSASSLRAFGHLSCCPVFVRILAERELLFLSSCVLSIFWEKIDAIFWLYYVHHSHPHCGW